MQLESKSLLEKWTTTLSTLSSSLISVVIVVCVEDKGHLSKSLPAPWWNSVIELGWPGLGSKCFYLLSLLQVNRRDQGPESSEAPVCLSQVGLVLRIQGQFNITHSSM